MNIKIIIAAHKPYKMPQDEIYLPLHVGMTDKSSIGFIGDNTGNNISEKNPTYCELTGIYWAWKNLEADYVGIAHYRRHFCFKKKKDKFDSVLNREQLEKLLQKSDIVLPKKQNYYIENLFSHYAHTHNAEHLNILGKVISEKYPEYLLEFERIKKRRSAHMFNMFIMKKEYIDAYCEWMFDIIFEIEKRIDISEYTSFEARLFGRISELMLDIWINTNHLEYVEIPVVYVEKIDWFAKIMRFIYAKFLKKKYGSSM